MHKPSDIHAEKHNKSNSRISICCNFRIKMNPKVKRLEIGFIIVEC